MAEIDDVRSQIDQASNSGDLATVARLSTRYRDLQAQAGQLPAVGNGFQAQTGREYQLANQALALRRAGREADATNLIRVISRERVARDASANTPQNDALAFGAGANHALFGVGNLINAGIDTITHAPGDNRTFGQRVEDLQRTQDAIRASHPLSSGAGEVAGVIATLPAAEATVGRVAQGATRLIPGARLLAPVARASEIGAEARAAELAARGGTGGAITRGLARSAVAGGVYGGASGGVDAAQRNEDVGQGATEGAEAGAAGGAALRTVGAVASPILQGLITRFSESGAVRQLAARLQEPVANLAARMADFTQRMGHPPSVAEIMGERGGRDLAGTISGHGNAVQTAITHSDATQLARPAQLATAISGGSRPVAAAEVGADASAAHTANMSRLGPNQVSLDDGDLKFLTGRDTRGLFRGSLTDLGQELRGHQAARDALNEAQSNLVEATNNASRAAQAVAAERARIPTIASPVARVNAKNALPGMERQAQRLVAAVNDARARVTAAAGEVRPASMTLRQLEDLRTASNEAANNSTGPQYFMHDVTTRIRGLAQNAGRPGAEYEQSLRDLAAGKAQAEGVTAGRGVVRTGAQAEQLAAARGEGTGPQQAASTQAGARQGVVTALQEDAGQGPRGAASTARDLAENPQLHTGLTETLGPTEAARLQAVGKTANDANTSLQAATPAHAVSVGDENARQTQNAMSAAVALAGHTGGAFKAHLITRIASTFGISSQAANHLAELAYNPQRSGELVRLLAQYSGNASRTRATMETLAGLLPARAAAAMRGEATPASDETPAAPAANTQSAQPVQPHEVSDDYLNHLAQVESGGVANASNPNSSAQGLHQFTEASWLATIRAHANDDPTLQRLAAAAADPAKRADVLALRNDPEISTAVARAFTADNLNSLESSLGREPSAGELYAAHFLGLGGAKRLIRLAGTSGQTNAAQEFPAAARANRTIFYNGNQPRSVAQVMAVLEHKWT